MILLLIHNLLLFKLKIKIPPKILNKLIKIISFHLLKEKVLIIKIKINNNKIKKIKTNNKYKKKFIHVLHYKLVI